LKSSTRIAEESGRWKSSSRRFGSGWRKPHSSAQSPSRRWLERLRRISRWVGWETGWGGCCLCLKLGSCWRSRVRSRKSAAVWGSIQKSRRLRFGSFRSAAGMLQGPATVWTLRAHWWGNRREWANWCPKSISLRKWRLLRRWGGLGVARGSCGVL